MERSGRREASPNPAGADPRAHAPSADDLLEDADSTRGHRLAALYVATSVRGLGSNPSAQGRYSSRSAGADQPEKRNAARPLRGWRDRALGYGGLRDVRRPRPSGHRLRPRRLSLGTVAAPEEHYDDYAGIDVTGKIVAYLAGAPRPSPTPPAPSSVIRTQARDRCQARRRGILQLSLPDEGSSWMRPSPAQDTARWLGGRGEKRTPYLAT